MIVKRDARSIKEMRVERVKRVTRVKRVVRVMRALSNCVARVIRQRFDVRGDAWNRCERPESALPSGPPQIHVVYRQHRSQIVFVDVPCKKGVDIGQMGVGGVDVRKLSSNLGYGVGTTLGYMRGTEYVGLAL